MLYYIRDYSGLVSIKLLVVDKLYLMIHGLHYLEKEEVDVSSVEVKTTEKEKLFFFKNKSIVGSDWKEKWYRITKRVLDIVLSIAGIVIAILPMGIISVLIVLESPGAAIYTQERIGKNGRPFRIYKFRTMYANADEMIANFTSEQKKEWDENYKLNNDPRITKIGKFLRKSSMDELPQLLNILKGDLAVVGPRPVVPKELEKYGDQQTKFLSVTPGLTGYWQAYARSSCSYEQRMEMELYYVDNACLVWDMKILLATIRAVLTGRGAK